MTDWAALHDAYGTAGDIPALLGAAERSGVQSGPEWNSVWSALYHQGTVYPASYAAIPLLADICARQRPSGYLAALHLACCILASTDGPEDPRRVHERYASDISRLRPVAEACLQLADNDPEFIYGLEMIAAIEDLGVWQRSLNYLPDGEAPLQCPRCGDDLLLRVEGRSGQTTSYDAAKGSRDVVPLASFGSPEQERLLACAADSGRQTVAAILRTCFGSTTCPECDATFTIADALS